MAHLLMLHGHPVGYLPPTYASEISYDENTTVKQKIDAKVDKAWQSIASNKTIAELPINISNTDYDEYIVLVVSRHTTPYTLYEFHFFKNLSLFSSTTRYVQGGSNDNCEMVASLSEIVSCAVTNGSNVRIYVSGR